MGHSGLRGALARSLLPSITRRQKGVRGVPQCTPGRGLPETCGLQARCEARFCTRDKCRSLYAHRGEASRHLAGGNEIDRSADFPVQAAYGSSCVVVR